MASTVRSPLNWAQLGSERRGHLFEGRFKARLVEGILYLLRLTRYVHLNPVKIAAL